MLMAFIFRATKNFLVVWLEQYVLTVGSYDQHIVLASPNIISYEYGLKLSLFMAENVCYHYQYLHTIETRDILESVVAELGNFT